MNYNQNKINKIYIILNKINFSPFSWYLFLNFTRSPQRPRFARLNKGFPPEIQKQIPRKGRMSVKFNEVDKKRAVNHLPLFFVVDNIYFPSAGLLMASRTFVSNSSISVGLAASSALTASRPCPSFCSP